MQTFQSPLLTEHRIRAVQFLQRVTFGPKDTEIDALAERMAEMGYREAAAEWTDEQLAIPATSQFEKIKSIMAAEDISPIASHKHGEKERYRDHAWWDIAIQAPDQLRQRVAWALSQIFVVNDDDMSMRWNISDAFGSARFMGIAYYYDYFVTATDKTYRDTLGEITWHPVMGRFLSSAGNQKGDTEAGTFPDENYAREILQLFSIGLYELNKDGSRKTDENGDVVETYDNEDIQEFARLFTGMNLDRSVPGVRTSFIVPMVVADPDRHDTSEKELFGVQLPAGADPTEDINSGLDVVADHPNVAPFISRLLIQRLVSSNPSRQYIQDVATVFDATGGNWSAVVKAILLHDEAWGTIDVADGVVTRSDKIRDRIMEPLLGVAYLVRRYGRSEYPGGTYMLTEDFCPIQGPYESPSVFNFYLPDHQPSGVVADTDAPPYLPTDDLHSPEMQILHPVGMQQLFGRLVGLVSDGRYDDRLDKRRSEMYRYMRMRFDFSAEESLAGDPAALVHHLNVVLCGGTMTESAHSVLNSSIAASTHDDPQVQRTNRARGAIMSVFASPAFWAVD